MVRVLGIDYSRDYLIGAGSVMAGLGILVFLAGIYLWFTEREGYGILLIVGIIIALGSLIYLLPGLNAPEEKNNGNNVSSEEFMGGLGMPPRSLSM